MNAYEMLTQLRKLPPGKTQAMLYLLAENLYAARLKNGEKLIETHDCVSWLREIGALAASTEGQLPAEISTRPQVPILASRFNPPRLEQRLEQAQIERICAGCSHVHEGYLQCGVDMGGAGKCECRMEVRV